MQLVRAGKKGGGFEFWESEGERERDRASEREREREPVGEDMSAELKMTFDTQEVQNAAWISFVSL